MFKSNTVIILVSSLAALCMFGNTCDNSVNAQNTACQLDAGVTISAADADGAQAHNRVLSS